MRERDGMRRKALVKLAIFGLMVLMAVGVVLFAGRGLALVSRSEETAAVFNVAAELPTELLGSVDWLPDDENLPRQMEPLTRVDITDTWLRSWAQLAILAETGDQSGLEVYFSGSALDGLAAGASDWAERPAEQIGHRLRLVFYSEDGQVVGLRSEESRVLRSHPVSGEPGWYDAVEEYEAIMLLEDGNWRLSHLVRRATDGAWWIEPPDPATDPVPEQLRGINYYPQSAPWQRVWLDVDPRVVAADLDRIADLGLDSVRIFLPFEELNGRWTEPDNLAPVLAFLDMADDRGLGVVVTLFDGRTDHRVFRWDADEDHLNRVVPVLAAHPALLMWDLKNEPDRDVGIFDTEIDLIYAWLGHMGRVVRDLDQSTPLTIGWATPEAAAAAPALVDVVSFHYYGEADELSAAVETIRANQGLGVPLLLSEYGLPTWNTIFPGGHTEQEQAAYYADILQVANEVDVGATMAWTLWDLAEPPPDAGSLPWATGPQTTLGLLHADGSEKLAAAVVGETDHAALEAVARPGIFHRFRKRFWIVAAVMGLGLVTLRQVGGVWKRRHDAQSLEGS